MPNFLIAISIFAAIIGVIFCCAERYYSSAVLAGVIAIGLAIWLIVYVNQPYRELKTHYIDMEERSGVQTATLILPDKDLQIFNLNKIFGRTFKTGTKFRVVERDIHGYYCGIFEIDKGDDRKRYLIFEAEPEKVDSK